MPGGWRGPSFGPASEAWQPDGLLPGKKGPCTQRPVSWHYLAASINWACRSGETTLIEKANKCHTGKIFFITPTYYRYVQLLISAILK